MATPVLYLYSVEVRNKTLQQMKLWMPLEHNGVFRAARMAWKRADAFLAELGLAGWEARVMRVEHRYTVVKRAR